MNRATIKEEGVGWVIYDDKNRKEKVCGRLSDCTRYFNREFGYVPTHLNVIPTTRIGKAEVLKYKG